MKYSTKIKHGKPSTVQDILKIALSKEKSAYGFYDQLLSDGKGRGSISVFKRLRDSEEEHIKIIQRMIDKEGSGILKSQSSSNIEYKKIEKYSKPRTPVEALELALVREKSAAEFYSGFISNVLGNTVNLGLLVVLKKLHNAEEAHIKIIERLLNR